MVVVAQGGGEGTTSEEGPLTFEKMIAGKGEEIVQGERETNDSADDEKEQEAESGDADSNEESGKASGDESEESSGDGDSDSADDDKGDEGKGKEVKADGKEGSDKEDLEKLEKEAPEGKFVALSHGEKEYKIPEAAKFTFEKDGKKVTFSLSQVGNQLVTRQELDQQLSRLDVEKKAVERRERTIQQTSLKHAEIEDKLNLIREAAGSGDTFDILQAAVNMFTDGDAAVTQKLFEQLTGLVSQVGEMTEDELKNSIKTSQLAFKNRKLESDKAKTDKQLASTQQETWLKNFVAENGIKWDEYVQAYRTIKRIDENRIAAGKPPRMHDKLTYQEAAQEVVVRVFAERFFGRVEKLVAQVDPTSAQKNEVIASICELTDPKYSDKDILDIVRGVLGTPEKKKVSKADTSSQGVSKAPVKSKDPETKEATPKRAPVAKETKKDDDEDEGPVTFATLKKRYNAN